MAGRLAVIGAGLMGSGIAQVAAQAGWQVTLRDLDDAATARGIAGIRKSLERFAAKGTITADDGRGGAGPDHHDHRPGGGRRRGHRGRGGLRAARGQARGLPRARQDLQGRTRCSPPTPRRSRSPRSRRSPQRPESVVGTHFFSPVPMMKLCELVRGYKTSDETLATARAFAEEVGKTCVVVNRDVAGFVTTRLISALVVEAVKLVESGVASRRGPRHRLQAGLRPRDGPAGHHRPDRRRRAAARRAATSTPTPRTRSSSRRSCCSAWSPPATSAARPARASTRTEPVAAHLAPERGAGERTYEKGHRL